MERHNFINAILTDPSSDTLRLIFADWLEEQGESPYSNFIRVQCELAHCERVRGDCPDFTASRTVIDNDIIRLRQREAALLYKLAPMEPFDHERTSWHGLKIGQSAITLVLKKGGPVALKFRRGFVAEITCTLADWIGGKPCNVCHDGFTIPANLCTYCGGTGRLPGYGPAIVAAHPVEKVVITDAVIHASGGNDTYYVGGLGRLPQQYWSQLEGLPSRGAAVAALSDALIAWAKGMV